MSLIRTAALRASAAPRMAVAARAASTTVVSSRSNESSALLANIEASWATLPASEQHEVYQKLEAVQKQDWNQLTVDEKKAGKCCLLPWSSKWSAKKAAILPGSKINGNENRAEHFGNARQRQLPTLRCG
jgi:hypothetical protein